MLVLNWETWSFSGFQCEAEMADTAEYWLVRVLKGDLITVE